MKNRNRAKTWNLANSILTEGVKGLTESYANDHWAL